MKLVQNLQMSYAPLLAILGFKKSIQTDSSSIHAFNQIGLSEG
jgi:hypothetical protein